ncbi:hypothetical protein GIB67_012922 [Kingdonia uniflora]|uniref:Transposase-associated domain-containing protein n=1 Tax=Kingdonia uniflora TaxID=39325 RepID=A0A7J7NFR2_9MAGN|nr:hypothetical protein GIB67_012922 [Kingdonia uniflora]
MNMSSANLNKNWMKASRLTYDFLNGVRSFIDYVKQTLGDMTYCPCNKCRNLNGVKTVDEIRTHLITYGIDQSYTTWYFHRESRDVTVDAHIQNPNESLITQHDDVERPRMFDLFDDAFGYTQPEDLNEGTQDGSYEGSDEFPEEEIKYQKLKDDASHLLYPSCSAADTIFFASFVATFTPILADSKSCKTAQNIRVKMKAMTNFVASVRDQNPREAKTIYYGVVKEIIERDYYDFPQTVFYCDWVRVEDKVNGCTFDAEENLIFVNLQKLKRNSKVDDEPYCLASQASQVFYCQDPIRTDWSVVIDAPKRLDKDIDTYEELLVFEIGNPFTSSMMGLINENVDEDEEITEGSWM